jgi:hypothetical protein
VDEKMEDGGEAALTRDSPSRIESSTAVISSVMASTSAES